MGKPDHSYCDTVTDWMNQLEEHKQKLSRTLVVHLSEQLPLKDLALKIHNILSDEVEAWMNTISEIIRDQRTS